MRIIYFGNGPRGVRCLEEMVAAGRIPELVVGQRGSKASGPGSVLDKATSLGLSVTVPERPDDPVFLASLRSLRPDVGVLVGYTLIIKQPLLEIPVHGFINLHGGKLPEYRGAAPINWQIICGEEQGGLTVLKADAGIDTGDILAESRYAIGPNDRYDQVSERVLELFPPLLLEVLDRYAIGNTHGAPQDLSKGAYWCKRYPEDGLVDFRSLDAQAVHNMVRALVPPMPGAFAYYKGQRIGLHRTELMEQDIMGRPGRISLMRPSGVVVIARDRGLLLKEICIEGSDEPVKAKELFSQTREMFDVVSC